MGITAKSVIFDIADNWGGGLIGVRQIDFWNDGTKITNIPDDYSAYATSRAGSTYNENYAFDTSKSKIGTISGTTWLAGSSTNQRLICVFDENTTFDEIRINNAHNSGGNTDYGAKNVVINTSTDEITSTTYNASISNSTQIFDGQFDRHVASNVEDEQTLTLNLPVVVSFSEMQVGLSLILGNITMEIIGDVSTTLPPFSLGLNGDMSPSEAWPMPVLEIGLALDGSPLIPVSLQPFELGLSMDMDDVSSFETGSAIIRYFCVLTGAADGLEDVTLPMASFQARRRSGDPTFLQVVVPTMDYADEIAARPNGALTIQQAYEQNGTIKQIETIMQADLDTVRTDEGGQNNSVTLTGYSTATFSAKSITLSGVTYRSTASGKARYRLARPYIFLNPGDTVTISDDGVTFEIDTMSYFINATTATIELESV